MPTGASLKKSPKAHSNKEIAAELNLSLRTIEGHICRILDKKSLNNRVELALQIAERGKEN